MNVVRLGRYLPRPVKKLVKPIYRLFTGPTKGDQYDKLTADVISNLLEDSSGAIDIGCHRGEILDLILKKAPLGRHYAFEPLPAFAAILRRRYQAHPNVKIFECALSDMKGHSTFQYNVTSPDYSGIRRRTYDRGDTNIKQIEVTVATLDSLIPVDDKVALIKLDVEGAEYQVLRGAIRVITETRPVIIFEHGIGGADHYETSPAMIFDFFELLEYDLYPLDKKFEASLCRDAIIEQFNCSINHYFCAVPKGQRRPF